MRKLITLFVPVFVLAGAAVAQPVVPPPPTPATPAAGAPHVQFAETVHDFGTVNAGAVLRADFVFTNTGSAMLEITEVRPTCGCTTAGAWSRQTQPGETGTIPLQLNTANFQGQVTKFVTVVCNDPAQPNLALQLKANIWKPVDVMPNFVMFNLSTESQTGEVRVVKITNNTQQPVELGTPEISNPAFHAEVKAVEAGKVFELHITTVGPFAPGTVQGTITLRPSGTNVPPLTVTALRMVQPPVVAMPAQVYLPPGPFGSPTPVTVLVQNNSSETLQMPEASLDVDNVQVQVRETQPGKTFSVNLTFPQGFQLPGGRPGTLSIKTSNTNVASLKVPIVQPPRPQTPSLPVPPPSIAAPSVPPSGLQGAPMPPIVPMAPPRVNPPPHPPGL